MHELVARRLREREELLRLARDYAEALDERIGIHSATVAGSVARGDFNVWSDIDVVIIARGLPERAPDRAALLLADAPPRIQPIGYTPAELERQRERGNPLVREATEVGVTLLGPRLGEEAASRR